MSVNILSGFAKRFRGLLAILGLLTASACASDLTGPRWNEVFTKDPRPFLETGMHTAAIRTIDIDEKGRYLVSGGEDKTVRVWCLQSDACNDPPALERILRVPLAGENVGKIYAVAIHDRWVAVGGWLTPQGEEDAIYVFDRDTGDVRARIDGLPNVTLNLTFSKDGRHLAATLGSDKGLRVYETGDFQLAFKDEDYTKSTYGADFDLAGRLYTVSFDGRIRRYDSSFKEPPLEQDTGQSEPFSVAVSPDGKRIAVGYWKEEDDTPEVVDLFSTDTLVRLHSVQPAPTTTDKDGNLVPVDGVGNLSSVAWSADGAYLYAAGTYRVTDTGDRYNRPLHSVGFWSEGGLGGFKLSSFGGNTIMGLRAYGKSGFAAGTQDPLLAFAAVPDQAPVTIESDIADFRLQRDHLLISEDGTTVQFGLKFDGVEPKRFDMTRSRYVDIPMDGFKPDITGLERAETQAETFEVIHWLNETKPKLSSVYSLGDVSLPTEVNLPSEKNVILPVAENETSRSLAIHGNRFLLGADWSLKAFDVTNGDCIKYDEKEEQLTCSPIWKKSTLAPTWAVNISGDGRRAVAAYGDGTIRWYDMKDGEELLALFPHRDGRRWVAWTPEGYFASSPGAENLIGYHLNRGPKEPPEFIEIERLYDTFYRPSLVYARLTGNPEVLTANVNTVLRDELPPVVEVVDGLRLSEDGRYLEFNAKVKARNGGIGRAVLRINGVELKARGLYGPRPDGRIRIGPGLVEDLDDLDEFELEVSNEGNTATSRGQIPHKNVDLANWPNRDPALFGLAVGISNYQNDKLNLKFAATDAKAFQETLSAVAPDKYAERVTIRTVTDKEATLEGIKSAYSSMIEEIHAGDLFVLYLSGHGHTLDGDYYFIPNRPDGAYQLNPSDLTYNDTEIREMGLSQQQLRTLLAAVPARNSVVILDTCYAGAFQSSDTVKYLSENLEGPGKLATLTGRAFLYASSSRDVAWEGYLKHGVYTYALIEGLRGMADKTADRNQQTTVSELSEYLVSKVQELTDGMQVPESEIPGKPFVIGQVR